MMMIKRFQPKATVEQWYALRQELAIKSWADRQRPSTDEEKAWLKRHPPLGAISVCRTSEMDDSLFDGDEAPEFDDDDAENDDASTTKEQ